MEAGLREIARDADARAARARADLVDAVRRAHRSGVTQAQIAKAIGRSQPEVSRLVHFHGTSALARRLRRQRRAVLSAVAAHGGSNVRVFGSVATGSDRGDSDVDLLFTPSRPLGLLELGRLERDISGLIGSPVDLVPDSDLHPRMAERILDEAIPL